MAFRNQFFLAWNKHPKIWRRLFISLLCEMVLLAICFLSELILNLSLKFHNFTDQIFGKPVAFSFMIMGCLFTYPATIAVQCETFGEYVIQGLGIEFCNPTTLYFCRKLIGFTLLGLFLSDSIRVFAIFA